MTNKYPMDFATINKGDYFSKEDCEKILGAKMADNIDKYRLKLLGLKEQIVRGLMHDGRILTVCIHHDGIKVCTDSEASEYNYSVFERAVRALFDAHYRNQNVDDSELSDEQRHTHRRVVQNQSVHVTAIIGARKTIKAELQAHKRIGAAPAMAEQPKE